MELPRLEPLYQKYKDKGLAVVAVEAQGDTEGATTFIDEHKLTYACLENGKDEGDVVRTVFGVRTFPTSYIIDREGRIMFYHLGFGEGDEEKLEEPAPEPAPVSQPEPAEVPDVDVRDEGAPPAWTRPLAWALTVVFLAALYGIYFL